VKRRCRRAARGSAPCRRQYPILCRNGPGVASRKPAHLTRCHGLGRGHCGIAIQRTRNPRHEKESARIGRENYAVYIRRNRRAGTELANTKHFERKCKRVGSRDTTRKARYSRCSATARPPAQGRYGDRRLIVRPEAFFPIFRPTPSIWEVIPAVARDSQTDSVERPS
jgi:hypothetical protein